MAHAFLGDVLKLGAVDAVRDLSERLNLYDWRVVGSTAVYYWTEANEQAGELDIATSSLDVLPAPGGTKFDYAHRHPTNNEGGHYAALLHGAAGLLKGSVKVDVFTQSDEPDPKFALLNPGGRVVPVRDANFQMFVSLSWLERRLTTNFGFGPHQKAAENVRALSGVVDWDAVEAIWQEQHRTGGSALKTMDWALKQVTREPGAKTSTLAHRIGLLRPCDGCDRSDARYPLIPGWQAIARVAVGRLRGRW